MSQKDHPETKEKNHIDERDIARAEQNTHQDAPLRGDATDAHIPDTELTNPSEDAKQSGEENDPTAGKSPSH